MASRANGRPPKISDKQADEIRRRLLAGERAADLAREYKVSRATISSRFSKQTEQVKTVANQLVAVERAFADLTLSEQVLARSLADDLRAISSHLASAAKFGSATAHRLAGIAHGKVQEIDDSAPLDEKSRDALRDVAVLSKMANEASNIGINLLAANKETVQRLNDAPQQSAPDLSTLTDEELRAAYAIAAKVRGATARS